MLQDLRGSYIKRQEPGFWDWAREHGENVAFPATIVLGAIALLCISLAFGAPYNGLGAAILLGP